MATLLLHTPVTITDAFAPLDIRDDAGLSDRNARQILQQPPYLPALSIFSPNLIKRLVEVEAGYTIHPNYLSQEVDLPMPSLRQGLEWGFHESNTPFCGTPGISTHGSLLWHNQPEPRGSTPDPPAIPYFTPRTTRFANIQQAQFWDKPPPAVDTFGHQERPIQPGPLQILYLAVCAFFSMFKTSLSNGIKLASFFLWEILWSLFQWLVVVPVLAIGRLVVALRLELIVSVVLAGWIVRKLPGFGEPLLSIGSASVARLGGARGFGGGDGEIERPAWTVFMKSGLAMGGNGAVLSE